MEFVAKGVSKPSIFLFFQLLTFYLSSLQPFIFYPPPQKLFIGRQPVFVLMPGLNPWLFRVFSCISWIANISGQFLPGGFFFLSRRHFLFIEEPIFNSEVQFKFFQKKQGQVNYFPFQ
jgi:hypothetical protein